MGTYYERLTAVAELDFDDSTEQAMYESTVKMIASCRETADRYRRDPGFNGKTAAAALDWLTDYQTRLEAKAQLLDIVVTRHELARAAMNAAKKDFSKLSPELLTHFEKDVVANQDSYRYDGRQITGKEYVALLAAEREADREAAAHAILTKMNDAVSEQAIDIYRDPEADNQSSAPSASRSPQRSPTFVPPHVVSRPKTSPDVSRPPLTGSPVDGGPANKPHPVQGYEPPPVVHRDDPRWSVDYRYQPPMGAGAIVGGVIGIGASVLAARAASSSLSGNAAMAFQSATGPGSASGLAGRAGGLSSAVSGRAPGGGMLSNAAANNGAKGAASRAGQAASGSKDKDKKEKRKKIKRAGYHAETLAEDERAPIDSPGAAAGTSADLAPLAEPDQDERW